MIRLTLPYPPSVNAMWRTPRSGPLAGRTMLSKEGRQYRADVIRALAGFKALPGRLRVTIEARAPDRRKRDLDNLPKAILDALTHAGLWLDDGQIDDLRVWRGPIVKDGQALVTVEQMAWAGQGDLLTPADAPQAKTPTAAPARGKAPAQPAAGGQDCPTAQAARPLPAPALP